MIAILHMNLRSARGLAILWLVAVGAMGACDTSTAMTSDATSDTFRLDEESADVATMDASPVDAPVDAPADVTRDRVAPDATVRVVLAPPHPDAPCASSAVIDLDTAGARRGDSVLWTGDARQAPWDPYFLPGDACGAALLYPRVFRLTARRAGALVVGVFNLSPDPAFVVAPVTTCAQGARTGACDNVLHAGRAGEIVTFVVARLARQTSIPPSAFLRVMVTEVGERQEGEPCATEYYRTVCARGSQCSRTPGADLCVRDGARFGRCLTGGRCLEGSCVEGRCRRLSMLGERCADDVACDEDLGCSTEVAPAVCVPRGSRGVRCREATDTRGRCDPGLGCSYGLCRLLVPVGAACGAAVQCAPGTHCRLGMCLTDGEEAGVCRPPPQSLCEHGLGCDASGNCSRHGATHTLAEGEPCGDSVPCTPGLECLRGTCRRALAAGDACDPATDVCTGYMWCIGGRCTSVLSAGFRRRCVVCLKTRRNNRHGFVK